MSTIYTLQPGQDISLSPTTTRTIVVAVDPGSITINLATSGQEVLVALWYSGSRTVEDTRTQVTHSSPSTTSHVYARALGQSGSSIQTDLVTHILPIAHGSVADQDVVARVVATGAKVALVPNLEIETNDVQCRHRSTVSPVRAEELYALATRGISPEDSVALIADAAYQEFVLHLKDTLNDAEYREVNEKLLKK